MILSTCETRHLFDISGSCSRRPRRASAPRTTRTTSTSTTRRSTAASRCRTRRAAAGETGAAAAWAAAAAEAWEAAEEGEAAGRTGERHGRVERKWSTGERGRMRRGLRG